MHILVALLLLLLGAMAAAPRLASTIPPVTKLTQSLAPYEGALGFIGMLVGMVAIYNSLTVIFYLSKLPMLGLLFWLLGLAGGLVLFKLGFCLAAPVMENSVFKDQPKLKNQVTYWKDRFTPYRELLGLFGVGLGLLGLLLSF